MRTAFIISFCIFSHFLWGQKNDISFVSDTIPFSLTESNNIVFPMIINQKDTLDIMLDTGANAIFITKEALSQKIALKLDKKGVTKGLVGTRESAHGNGFTIQIGNTTWTNQQISESELSSEKTDGKIGYNLFKDKILQVDYDQKKLIISASLPSEIDTYTKVPIVFDTSYFKVRLNISDQKQNALVLFDTGFGGSLLLSPSFWNNHDKIKSSQKIDSLVLRDANGAKIYTRIIELKKVGINDLVLHDVPAMLSNKGRLNVIGSNFIRRFNFIVDIHNKYLYLKKNMHYGKNFASWKD